MICKQCGSPELKQIGPDLYQCQRCLSESEAVFSQPSTPLNEPAIKPKESLNFNNVEGAIVRLQGDNGTGTGFFFHQDGYVLTNAHVVKDQEIIQGYIGSSPVLYEFELHANGDILDLDLAVLKVIDDADYKVLKFAHELPKLADNLIAVGNPKNLGISVSKGALSRITDKEYQLDLTVNPGNSGGPVINEDGEVVGVISYLLQEVQGLGFAINLLTIKTFLKLVFKSKEEGRSNV